MLVVIYVDARPANGPHVLVNQFFLREPGWMAVAPTYPS